MSKSHKGSIGERLIAEFFDKKFSRDFCFANPRNKLNQEIADVLVWWNRHILLIEVKTKDTSQLTPERWAHTRIQSATCQIATNHSRIINRDVINLKNTKYDLPLSIDGVVYFHGLVVLMNEDRLPIYSIDAVPAIYDLQPSIQVMTWNNLERLTSEIDTIPDLFFYLQDRFAYVKEFGDIILDSEMNVIAEYKMLDNKFPDHRVDFSASDSWRRYVREMAA